MSRESTRHMGREVVRDGVRGHVIEVAPRKGYTRFVRSHYNKGDGPAPRRSHR